MNAKTTTPRAGFYFLPRSEYSDLSQGAFDLLCRLVVLTKKGSQGCTYTNSKGCEEFDVTDRTIVRRVNELVKAQYISTEKGSSSHGSSVRLVSLNLDKVKIKAASKGAEQQASAPVDDATPSPHEVTTNTPQSVVTCRDSVVTREDIREDICHDSVATREDICHDICRDMCHDTMSLGDGSLRLIYISGVAFPYSIEIKNIEKLIKQTNLAKSLSPQLFTNVTSFDLSSLSNKLPKALTPFGQPHDFRFDFSPILNTYSYSNVQALRDKPAEFWHAFNDFNEPLWRDFFVFTMLIELTCFADQCFDVAKDLDKFGGNFKQFYFENQYGLLFTVLNAVYPAGDEDEEAGLVVYRSIKNSYRLGADLLKFTRGGVVRAVINALNDPNACQCAYEAWRGAFFLTMSRSFRIWTIKHLPPSDSRYAERYFDPDIARYLLCDEYGFAPRLTMPLLMFRRVVVLHHAARISEDGPNDYSTQKAIAFIEHQQASHANAAAWTYLCENLGDLFPFMREHGVYECV